MSDLDRVRLTGDLNSQFQTILTPEAQRFLLALHSSFEPRRRKLLAARVERQAKIDRGVFPDFLPETRAIREASWTVAPIPADLMDRRVEITGPVDRKMVINALNSGARAFMADFEDSHSPTWKGTIEGQINLRDAVRRAISLKTAEGKQYALNEKIATLLVRPRGWHLSEKHMLIDGAPISASLFDFGLFFFHNAREQLSRGSGPYFYLPKMESHLEARLWNDVFIQAQQAIGLPRGTIRATVLIETILAAFEMDEILHELREHSAGLNCGRWDYIFSFIKKFRSHPAFVLPDRVEVTMTSHFLSSYVSLLIRTCHRRGAHAMGGMAAQIPIKGDPAANEAAMGKVRADKLREVTAGHDGTWVAHPALVPIAQAIFDEGMKTPNQIAKAPGEARAVSASDLLAVPKGTITEVGLRKNITITLLYLESWLKGLGCVPLFHLMEDAATAEISRAQIWQWIRHPLGKLEDGRKITLEMVRSILGEELEKIPANPQLKAAARLLEKITADDAFVEFLTLPAYDLID